MGRLLATLALFSLLVVACASAGPNPAARDWRAKLSDAIREPVSTREKRDEHSRVLVEAVENDALEGLNLAEVQAAFGHGEPCSGQSLCAEQGFSGDDLYFPVGERADDSIKQLPVLVVGFDPHGLVKRVYTLRTH